jgi:hypothetical protein
MRFSAPHFAHLLSIRVLPCLMVMALRSNASFTKRSVASRIACFDIISCFLHDRCIQPVANQGNDWVLSCMSAPATNPHPRSNEASNRPQTLVPTPIDGVGTGRHAGQWTTLNRAEEAHGLSFSSLVPSGWEISRVGFPLRRHLDLGSHESPQRLLTRCR